MTIQRGACLYPGSFDPVTNGHWDIIRRAAEIFEKVYVGVLINADKKPSFTIAERVRMLQLTTEACSNVEVVSFEGLTAELCRRLSVRVMVRGLRGAADLEEETRLAALNGMLLPGLETVFLPASAAAASVSSSAVRQIAALGGDISSMVPGAVLPLITARFRKD